MHPYRGLVCTYRRSNGLSTIPDKPNTFTCQSAGRNNTPQGPTSRSHYVESWPITDQIYATSIPTVPLTSWSPQTLRYCVNSPLIAATVIQRLHHHRRRKFRTGRRFRLDLTWFDPPFPTGFDSKFSTWFDLVFSIRFDSRVTHLFSIRLTSFNSHSSQYSWSPTLARVYLK